MAARRDARRRQKLGVDVQPLRAHRIGDQHLPGQLCGLGIGLGRQWVAFGDHQHLLIVEHGLEMQTGFEKRVRRDQQVDLIAKQRADSAELEFLLHIHVHVRPGGQVGRHDLQQPLITRVAFHADPQRATLALRKLPQEVFSKVQLGQDAVGHSQHVLAGLCETQAAALAQPDVGAQLLLQLLHAVAQRGLGDTQHIGRRSE